MLNKRYVRKIEKETNKRLRKFYRDSAYFYIDQITFNWSDCEDIVYIKARAGFKYETDGKEQYTQIDVRFAPSVDAIQNAGEFAAILYFHIVSRLDNIDYFEEN
jgi:hypothetical protein